MDLPSIVVTSTGSGSAAAVSAIAQIILRPPYAPPMEPPDPAAVIPMATPGVEIAQVDAVVAALVAAGVNEADIRTNVAGPSTGGMFGPGSAVIVFQLDGDAVGSLSDLLAVATSTATEFGLAADPPGAMYLADSCQDVRAIAFADAVEQGNQEAALIAEALGVEITRLLQARKISISFGPIAYGYSGSDACEDLVDLESAARTYLPTFDATFPVEFSVYAMMELTFLTT
jgi:subtilisin family serine protease